MPIFIYYFDCILQGSKFINVTAFRMVNIYLYWGSHEKWQSFIVRKE